MGRNQLATRAAEPAPSSTRRDEIVRVASALLREKGVRVSLQDIADELGITYNALYHHFKSRDDLILQCLLRSSALLHETLIAASALSSSGLDRVLGFLHDFWALSVRERTPPGLLFTVLPSDGQLALAERSAVCSEILQGLISEGIADGSIRPCDPLVAATLILHTIYWWPHELDAVRQPEQLAQSILEFTRQSLACP